MPAHKLPAPLHFCGDLRIRHAQDAFWGALKEIAKEREQTLSDLVSEIDKDGELANLSSAIRLFVLGYARDQAEAAARRSAQTATEMNEPIGAA
jgi:predicted DNA-binding ribbon-helix-helix protein